MATFRAPLISSPVGLAGANVKRDVLVVQHLLNRAGGRERLQEDGVAGCRTIEAIRHYQRTVLRYPHPDMRVDPGGRMTARGPGGRPIRGAFSLRGEELRLDLPQVNDFDGCTVPQGEALQGSRTLTAAWIDLARITVSRARFRANPTGKMTPRFIVQGDLVGVLPRQGGAMLVEYVSGEGKPVQGGIAATEARPLG